MREKQFWTDSGKKETILLDIDMHKLYELHVCKCISSTNIVQNCMPQAVSQVVSTNDRRTEEWQKNYRNLSSNQKTVLCRMYSFRWPFSRNSTRSNIVFLRIGRFACFFISSSIISLSPRATSRLLANAKNSTLFIFRTKIPRHPCALSK